MVSLHSSNRSCLYLTTGHLHMLCQDHCPLVPCMSDSFSVLKSQLYVTSSEKLPVSSAKCWKGQPCPHSSAWAPLMIIILIICFLDYLFLLAPPDWASQKQIMFNTMSIDSLLTAEPVDMYWISKWINQWIANTRTFWNCKHKWRYARSRGRDHQSEGWGLGPQQRVIAVNEPASGDKEHSIASNSSRTSLIWR